METRDLFDWCIRDGETRYQFEGRVLADSADEAEELVSRAFPTDQVLYVRLARLSPASENAVG